jgi:cell wall-associated NlpC family hydrolase
MNGFLIPRNSRMQYKKGKKISKSNLKKGDLVFFATGSNRYRITHVGMYVGSGTFVHAPGRGKRVRKAKLSNSYFKRRYIGAVTYLQ